VKEKMIYTEQVKTGFAYNYLFGANPSIVSQANYQKSYGFSVRCLKD